MNQSQNNTGTLVITRHGESEWNLLGKWTGWTDVGLTEKGASDAEEIGKIIGDFEYDEIYTSVLKRTEETLQGIIRGLGRPEMNELPKTANAALNERDYGVYTGKEKWEVKEEVGEDEFTVIRRGWDNVIPEGENLKQVYDRVIPYFKAEILPKLQAGKTILVVAHGNSIRALIKYLDRISDEDIADVEMKFGKVLIYRFKQGNDRPVDKKERQADIEQTHA
ncbi:2,3-diphosphoglycerate-dependent phosphoglycerate mutase [Candidatus Saccharibacteria bacterium]|nr:2,3-diphosphoglycerate-dependent phosphoglycerate mutase [Candidatus Saccharibacteria bacterium]NCU40239.1 2,3-diphosphoglycerate-dependent phosphoglycerate mutase [Candidatus Saccharibacteria bacterium]